MKIGITGASGLIGTPLVRSLRTDGHQVVRFVRGAASGADERSWDPGARRLDPADVADLDAVVHLAGAGVADKRWSDSRKRVVLDSRVDGTTAVATAMAQAQGPKVLLSASAIGWYGDTGDRLTDETGPSGKGFLADVCRQWEAATAPAEAAGIRVAHLRTGIVLSGKGGALAKQVPIFKAFLGAPLGTGRQWTSWISLRDELAAIRHCLVADVRGPVNLVGPGAGHEPRLHEGAGPRAAPAHAARPDPGVRAQGGAGAVRRGGRADRPAAPARGPAAHRLRLRRPRRRQRAGQLPVAPYSCDDLRLEVPRRASDLPTRRRSARRARGQASGTTSTRRQPSGVRASCTAYGASPRSGARLTTAPVASRTS